jgi:hypothetical protein
VLFVLIYYFPTAFDIQEWMNMSVDEKQWETTLSSEGRALQSSTSTGGEATATTTTSDNNKKNKEENPISNTTKNDLSRVQDETRGEVAPNNDKAAAASATAPGKVKEEADVFRIRSEEKDIAMTTTTSPDATTTATNSTPAEAKPAEVAAKITNKKEKKGGEDQKKGAETKATGALPKTAKEIADNVCVVRSTAGDDVPFVTIHPSFLKRKGTGECVRCLDNLFQAIVPSSKGFLSMDVVPVAHKDDPETLVLQRLQSLMDATADDNNNKQQKQCPRDAHSDPAGANRSGRVHGIPP